MPWVEHRKDRPKPWRAKWRDPAGKECSRSFRLKREAERYLASVEVAKDAGTYVDPAKGRTVYGVWHEKWAPTRLKLRESTRHRDDVYLASHILPRWGRIPLAAIDYEDVQGWVGELKDGGLAPATVHKVVGIFAKSLDAAVKAKHVAANPARGVELPPIKTEETRFLTAEQVADLADAIDPRYRALVLVLAYGGLRIGEALALTRADYDPMRGVVSVERTASWVQGRLTLNAPKTDSGRRKVRIPRFVMEALAAHLASHDHDIIFPAARGGHLEPSRFRGRYWTAATKAAGLAPLRIHDLRHTAVSLWIAAGTNPKLVSTMAGHGSVAFTLDRYGHLYDDAADGLMKSLEAKAQQAAVRPTRSPNVVSLDAARR